MLWLGHLRMFESACFDRLNMTNDRLNMTNHKFIDYFNRFDVMYKNEMSA